MLWRAMYGNIHLTLSYVAIQAFPLEKSGFPSTVNNRCRDYRLRDKSDHERGGVHG